MKKRKIPEAVRDKIKASTVNSSYICDNLQGALPAISLVSHSALISAFSNDVAADMVFAQQVYGYAKPGDCLIGISTSGNAANVLCAGIAAKANGVKTIAMTGERGGKMKDLFDITIAVPATSTPEIQELHLPVYHAICMTVEEEMF